LPHINSRGPSNGRAFSRAAWFEQIDNGQVTFRYRESRTQKLRRVTVSGLEFIARFLQHVLPQGCAKVRYYGIWAGSCRQQREQARALLSNMPPLDTAPSASPAPALDPTALAASAARCPRCHLGQLVLVQVLLPEREIPP